MNAIKNINIDAVITSYNQGEMIREAVNSVCNQTCLPQKIIIVDDGSKDEKSLEVLHELEKENLPVSLEVIYQDNGGVSNARNTGIHRSNSAYVLVLDGDDMIEPEYIELVGKLIDANPDLVAASSHIKTFGVLESVVRPSGGAIGAFLSHNCCPATHILRKSAYDKTSGYDETMRSGFEDWDFFLSMLETSESAEIGIVKKPLIKYRTAPASSNIKSMDKRLNLMKFIMDKHSTSYHEHMAEALLGIEAISSERLYAWENEIVHSFSENGSISDNATAFLQSPTYGDGGMAAAVRIMSKNGAK